MSKQKRTYNLNTQSSHGSARTSARTSARASARAAKRASAQASQRVSSRGMGRSTGGGVGRGASGGTGRSMSGGIGRGAGGGMGRGTGRGSSRNPQTGGNAKTLVSRRAFLFGAAGVGVGAAAVGVYMTTKGKAQKEDTSIHTLTVPETAVTASTDLAEKETGLCVAEFSQVKLPFGTLVFSSSDNMAVCLLPGETASPLTSVGILWYSSDSVQTVLSQAVSKAEGFDIYDVRGNSEGLVWTEADILDGTWRVYSAVVNGMGTLEEPALLAEGNSSSWEMPLLAAVGPYAFWQMRPKTTGDAKKEASTLHRARFGVKEDKEMWSSTGRFATAPYPLDDKIVVTPRADSDGVNYQLTLLNAGSGAVEDTLILPQSMRPFEVGYGPTGFSFCFDGIYDYGDGIANLGTYTPMSNRVAGADAASYDNAPWFRFARTPNATPCWCGNFFMVKSTSAVCGADFSDSSYFVIDVESGAASYGDYLASTGVRQRIAVYSNVTYRPLNGSQEQYCNVRIFSAL